MEDYCIVCLRPQPTRRTSWKLVANPGCQLVRICNFGLETSWQLVASLVVLYIPLVQQVANLHVVIDLSGCQLVANPKKLRVVSN